MQQERPIHIMLFGCLEENNEQKDDFCDFYESYYLRIHHFGGYLCKNQRSSSSLSTPFTIGELWVTNTTESTDILLGEVDAGRGYPPIWGSDGNSLVYIHRENPASLQANYRAEALYSNIYQVDLTTYQVSPLTQFTNTLVYDAVWSPNGSQLAFTAGDAVWLLEPGQSPMQLTSPGIAHHPAWITLPTP